MPNPIHWVGPVGNCDLCCKPLSSQLDFYDAIVPAAGAWGKLCHYCFGECGAKLGTGKGQKFQRQNDGTFLKVEG